MIVWVFKVLKMLLVSVDVVLFLVLSMMVMLLKCWFVDVMR